MINNQSIAIHAFPMHMLILLSVDEILLLRYVKGFTNFRGLPLDEEMALCLKYEFCFICIHTEADTTG